MCTAIWALFALGILPDPGGLVVDRVWRIEVNQVVSPCGRPIYRQILFWDRLGGQPRLKAYRMLNTCCGLRERLPERDFRRGGWTLRWLDSGILREVRAQERLETRTAYDPEYEARNGLRHGEFQRPGLIGEPP